MQAASSSYLPPPHPFYYHVQSFGPQDHDLKRQYLTLLSPQQIIDICLSCDVHVPPYIKSTIWPPDINAAIENLRKTTANEGGPVSAPNDSDKPQEEAPMDSLQKPSEADTDFRPDAPSTESQAAEPQLPEKQPKGILATTASPAATPTSPPAATAPAHPPVQQQPLYPHQPYGYPQHPPAAYPHAPYYPPPPGYPSYSPYPPAPNGYHHPPPPPNTGYPQLPNPMYPPSHTPQPPTHQDQGSDDLPSYEEMIVEALQESTDPEGCAPKDLFAWMAARYPLQSNFRPSASQALQKAFKRGRFEKSSNGKYRLSATWEGGNTSRRTTRRPQTQNQSQSSALAPPAASPFTHSPLVHHHHSGPTQQNVHPQPYLGQPYPYLYGGPMPPGYPGYPHPQPQPQSQPPAQQQQNLSEASVTATTMTVNSTTGDLNSEADRDAYEAAQNILKAINFGDLLQIAQEEGNGKKVDAVSVDQLTSLLVQAQSGLLQSGGSQPATAPPQSTGNADSLNPVPRTLPSTSERALGSPNARAELQAQLVLLATQLADLGQESGEIAHAAQRILPAARNPQELQQQPSATTSTDFEPPPMDSLLPPPEFSLPQASTNSSPSTPQQERQSAVIPIDPALRPPASTVQPESVLIQSAGAIQQSPAPAPPPSAVPTADSLPPNSVEGEDDSEDEEMEEII